MIILNRPLTQEEQHLVALLGKLERSLNGALQSTGYSSYNYWMSDASDQSKQIQKEIRLLDAKRFQQEMSAPGELSLSMN